MPGTFLLPLSLPLQLSCSCCWPLVMETIVVVVEAAEAADDEEAAVAEEAVAADFVVAEEGLMVVLSLEKEICK